MKTIILLISIVLMAAAIKFHTLSQANVKTKVDKAWFDRLWSGSRASKDNLNDKGLQYRKQSNIYVVAGLLTLGLYVYLSASAE